MCRWAGTISDRLLRRWSDRCPGASEDVCVGSYERSKQVFIKQSIDSIYIMIRIDLTNILLH